MMVQFAVLLPPLTAYSLEGNFTTHGQTCIDRAAVTACMNSWVSAKVGYCYPDHETCGCSHATVSGGVSCEEFNPGLRCDCSGFASSCLAPGGMPDGIAQWSTASAWDQLPATATSNVGDLQPGDFMVAHNSKHQHMVMFWSFDGSSVHYAQEPGCKGTTTWAENTTKSLAEVEDYGYVYYRAKACGPGPAPSPPPPPSPTPAPGPTGEVVMIDAYAQLWLHSAPDASTATHVKELPNHTPVTISCQAKGPSETGSQGTTTAWYNVAALGYHGYGTAAFIQTSAAIPAC